MTRRSRALFHRRQLVIAPRVERSVTAIQRNVPTNGRGLDAGNIAQRVEQLFDKTLTRCSVGILRSGQCDRAGPEVLRPETEILLTQTNETRDEQRRAGKQRHRKRNLRSNQNLAQPLLAATATGSAAALFQSVNEVCTRGLHGRINSHQQSSQK